MCSGQHTVALSGSHVSKNILVRAPCMACSTGGIRFKWLSDHDLRKNMSQKQAAGA